MKSKQINSTLADLVQKNSSMSSYLSSLSRGREATPHSWLYEHEDADNIMQRWIPIMKAANNKTEFGEEFNQFDLKQVEKFGPQGCVPPIASEEAQETLTPLYSPTEYDSQSALDEYWPYAKKFAQEVFGPRLKTKRPLGFKSVIDDMRARDTLVTNSGFPRFKKRNLVLDQEIQDAESGRAYEYPAIILFRAYNGKLRPVWMFPMSLNLIEFQFSQVIQEALQNSPAGWVRLYLSPWKGYEDVKLSLTSHWRASQPIIGGDTTKMDAHMRPAQIRLVFECVKWLFQEAYWPDLLKSLIHICEIDLLYSHSHVYTGIHGLASGSGWTQLTETVLQLFMAWMRSVHGQGIGDDFYWLDNMNAQEIVDYLGKFGLPANPSKQTVSTNSLTFLQRLNRQGFFSRENPACLGAYYPTIRALNSMLWPEKFHKPKEWSSDMFCIRNFMILENCVDNPCFDEFVKFVTRGHKDLIPFAKQSAAYLDSVQDTARQVSGLNPSYNQEKREKPLSSFASIQLAKTL
nr:MAG: putative RNA-dependent RNA polymerase [Picobirnavirus sp.]